MHTYLYSTTRLTIIGVNNSKWQQVIEWASAQTAGWKVWKLRVIASITFPNIAVQRVS